MSEKLSANNYQEFQRRGIYGIRDFVQFTKARRSALEELMSIGTIDQSLAQAVLNEDSLHTGIKTEIIGIIQGHLLVEHTLTKKKAKPQYDGVASRMVALKFLGTRSIDDTMMLARKLGASFDQIGFMLDELIHMDVKR